MTENEAHDLKKTLIEIQCLLAVCSSIPSFTTDWTKSERPDWLNKEECGLEMIAAWPVDQRELYDYKCPIGNDLSYAINTKYKLDFYGKFITIDNDKFIYDSLNHSIVNKEGNIISLDNLEQSVKAQYNSAICYLICPNEYNIGAHVLDYQQLAIEALKKKLDRINQPDFRKKPVNLLCITCPIISDLRWKYVEKLLNSFVKIQNDPKYAVVFDTIYLNTSSGILVISTKEESIDYYMTRKYDGNIDVNKVNALVNQKIAFDLYDICEPIKPFNNPVLRMDPTSEFPPELQLKWIKKERN